MLQRLGLRRWPAMEERHLDYHCCWDKAFALMPWPIQKPLKCGVVPLLEQGAGRCPVKVPQQGWRKACTARMAIIAVAASPTARIVTLLLRRLLAVIQDQEVGCLPCPARLVLDGLKVLFHGFGDHQPGPLSFV